MFSIFPALVPQLSIYVNCTLADLGASILGIVSAGTKTTLILAQLASDVGSAGLEIRMLGAEIRVFTAVLSTLEATLQKVQESPYFAHCTEVVEKMTDASLEMFTDIVNEAEELGEMVKGKEGKDGKVGIKDRFQWAMFRRPKMMMLRAAIEAYKSNLSLMLGTLSITERVGRRTSMVNTQKVVAEDEHDRSMLQILQLEPPTSLIELEEAQCQFSDTTTEWINAAGLASDLHRSRHDTVEEDRGLATRFKDTESRTDGLVGSVREEIKSLRFSHSSTSHFDTAAVQQQVAQYNQRLSLLMSTDQKTISQRWSTVLSPEYKAESYIPWLNTPRARKPPPAPIGIPLHPYFQIDPSDNLAIDRHWPSTNTVLPTFRLNYQHEESILQDEAKDHFSALSDPFYLETFNQLMKRSPKDRQTIVDTLVKDACGNTKPDRNRAKQGTESFDGSDDDYGLQTQHERRVQEYRRKLKNIEGTQQWHKTREIQQLVKKQWQANIKDSDFDSGNLLLKFDLSYQEMKVLPELTIETLRYGLERLVLSHNHLAKLPANIAL